MGLLTGCFPAQTNVSQWHAEAGRSVLEFQQARDIIALKLIGLFTEPSAGIPLLTWQAPAELSKAPQ